MAQTITMIEGNWVESFPRKNLPRAGHIKWSKHCLKKELPKPGEKILSLRLQVFDEGKILDWVKWLICLELKGVASQFADF